MFSKQLQEKGFWVSLSLPVREKTPELFTWSWKKGMGSLEPRA